MVKIQCNAIITVHSSLIKYTLNAKIHGLDHTQNRKSSYIINNSLHVLDSRPTKSITSKLSRY